MNTTLNDNLIFTDTDGKEKAVLGTLEGPCADIIHGTRNGRRYSESLWERVFNSNIFKEMIENGGIPGELDHPVDREETDSSRIAVILREVPKKKNGLLWAKFDILNTPLGKIAYTLAKAGFKLGVSSRGSGDVSPGFDGVEEVDETTYDFKAFDLVLLPAVESARLNLVTEAFNTKKFNYKKQLLEFVESSSNEDKQLMLETLSNMNINILNEDVDPTHYTEVINSINNGIDDSDIEGLTNYLKDIISYCKSVARDYDINDDSLNINCVQEETMPVENNEGEIEALQESLKENKNLSNTIKDLQEKLSVSYTKEVKLHSTLDSHLRSIKKLSEECKQLEPLKSRINILNEDLSKANSSLQASKDKLSQLSVDNENLRKSRSVLKEELGKRDEEISNLQERLQSLNEAYEQRENELNESISELKTDYELKLSKYSEKLSQTNKLVEKYKSTTQKSVDRYIELQANMIGVSKNEIKNRLSEKYSFTDIDNVCEELRNYRLNISKLPFRTSGSLTENVKFKTTPSKKESILPADNLEDEVDDQLKALAGLL